MELNSNLSEALANLIHTKLSEIKTMADNQ